MQQRAMRGISVDNYRIEGLVVGDAVPIGSGLVPVMRILAPNAGMMTGPGTNSYLIGDQELALLDPGPLDQGHIDTLLRHVGERSLKWIFVTHTHGDHSPAAAAISAATGATLIGLLAPEGSDQDPSFVPMREYSDGERVECGSFTIRLVHTPGHVSNHFCYLLEEEQMLFTGDHILDGTTPVILPPYGNMGHYFESLYKVKALNVQSLAPGHGRLMSEPNKVIETLIRHRLRRESKVVQALKPYTSSEIAVELEDLTAAVYDDVPQALHVWASKTLLAHLQKLRDDGRAGNSGQRWYGVDES
jgi:glyoxylase-like metal-dependent hydrolase (beta-lactamase superfamily II)